MGRKKDVLKSLAGTFGPSYDSDKDLTLAEQRKIKNSYKPNKTRKKIWEEKDTWKKTKKLMKSGFYGDKQADKYRDKGK